MQENFSGRDISKREGEARAEILQQGRNFRGEADEQEQVHELNSRIIRALEENNSTPREREQAITWARIGLRFIARAGLSVSEVQQDRDYVRFTPVPKSIDLYLNLHDGRLYAREVQGYATAPTHLQSYEDVQTVLEI